MDTARNGDGRLVEHANRQGPWLAPGQRSLAGPGIRDFLIRYFVNSDSTSDECGAEVERFMRGPGSERARKRGHRASHPPVTCVETGSYLYPDAYWPRACVRSAW